LKVLGKCTIVMATIFRAITFSHKSKVKDCIFGRMHSTMEALRKMRCKDSLRLNSQRTSTMKGKSKTVKDVATACTSTPMETSLEENGKMIKRSMDYTGSKMALPLKAGSS
jgi:hypothetical protein